MSIPTNGNNSLITAKAFSSSILVRLTLLLFFIGVVISCIYYFSEKDLYSPSYTSLERVRSQKSHLFSTANTKLPVDGMQKKASSFANHFEQTPNSTRRLFTRQWHLDLEGHNNNLNRDSTNYVYPLRWLTEDNQKIDDPSNRTSSFSFIVLATRYHEATGEFVLLTAVHSYQQVLKGIHQWLRFENFPVRRLLTISISVQFIYQRGDTTHTSLPTACRIKVVTGVNEFYCRWPEFPAALPPDNLTIRINYHGSPSDFFSISRRLVNERFLWNRYANQTKAMLGRLSYPTLWSMDLAVVATLDPITTVAFCSAPLYSPHYNETMPHFLDYHLFMGVERFTIFDRFGQYYDTLKPYIDADIVDYQHTGRLEFKHYISPYYDQTYMMEVCRFRHFASSSWIGFWDFDEYIIIPVDTNHTLKSRESFETHTSPSRESKESPSTVDTESTNNFADLSITSDQTNLFPSSCVHYNANTGIFELNYNEIDIAAIEESLRTRPFRFRRSPQLSASDPSNILSDFHIYSAEEYLSHHSGHCRSLLSDFFIQQTIRANQIDLIAENLVVNVIQFIDPLVNQGDEEKKKLFYPERFGCFECEKDYLFSVNRIDPFKSFHMPQSDSHIDIHTTFGDSNKVEYMNQHYQYRAKEKTRGPLNSDQLFFAHFRNAIVARDPSSFMDNVDPSINPPFWNEGLKTAKLINSMKGAQPQQI